jgi:hypothetical protein
MTRKLLITFMTLVLGATSPALADTRNKRQGRHDPSFAGSCRFSTKVVFQPPLTNTPQTVTDTARGTGTCSGTLTGQSGRTQQLDNAPVTYLASDQGTNSSCAAATATGSGTLAFPDGKISFALSETRGASTAALSLTGKTAGSAYGLATISPSANPITLAQDCAGRGITQTNVDIQLSTTPSISS